MLTLLNLNLCAKEVVCVHICKLESRTFFLIIYLLHYLSHALWSSDGLKYINGVLVSMKQ